MIDVEEDSGPRLHEVEQRHDTYCFELMSLMLSITGAQVIFFYVYTYIKCLYFVAVFVFVHFLSNQTARA